MLIDDPSSNILLDQHQKEALECNMSINEASQMERKWKNNVLKAAWFKAIYSQVCKDLCHSPTKTNEIVKFLELCNSSKMPHRGGTGKGGSGGNGGLGSEDNNPSGGSSSGNGQGGGSGGNGGLGSEDNNPSSGSSSGNGQGVGNGNSGGDGGLGSKNSPRGGSGNGEGQGNGGKNGGHGGEDVTRVGAGAVGPHVPLAAVAVRAFQL
jgi:hypothetical protein